jgi:hypothetical protein
MPANVGGGCDGDCSFVFFPDVTARWSRLLHLSAALLRTRGTASALPASTPLPVALFAVICVVSLPRTLDWSQCSY